MLLTFCRRCSIRLLNGTLRTSQARNSHIGRAPVDIPDTVAVSTLIVKDSRNRDQQLVRVAGPNGTLEFPLMKFISIEELESESNGSGVDGMSLKKVVVTCLNPDEKFQRSMWGTTRALLNNFVTGVSEGHVYTLSFRGVGYRAALEDSTLILRVGYSQPVRVPVPEGINVTVQSPTSLIVKGVDKQVVGLFCATVRRTRPPEPYKGKVCNPNSPYSSLLCGGSSSILELANSNYLKGNICK